jgi:hypothetical protein
VGARAPIPTGRGAAVECVPEAGAEPLTNGSSVEVLVGTAKVPAGAVDG